MKVMRVSDLPAASQPASTRMDLHHSASFAGVTSHSASQFGTLLEQGLEVAATIHDSRYPHI
jgi:hypothetical protein